MRVRGLSHYRNRALQPRSGSCHDADGRACGRGAHQVQKARRFARRRIRDGGADYDSRTRSFGTCRAGERGDRFYGAHSRRGGGSRALPCARHRENRVSAGSFHAVDVLLSHDFRPVRDPLIHGEEQILGATLRFGRRDDGAHHRSLYYGARRGNRNHDRRAARGGKQLRAHCALFGRPLACGGDFIADGERGTRVRVAHLFG